MPGSSSSSSESASRADRPHAAVRLRRLWRNHGLSLTVATLFVASWILQTVLGWGEFAAEQAALGEEPEIFGPTGYLWSWGRATFENWQSEFLQVFVFIVITTFLVHRHSHESPDTDYQTEAALRRIEARLDGLEANITAAQVEREHLAQVSAARHWAYLAGVVGVGFLLTIVLLAAIQAAVAR
jgi:hypothetical protein